VNVRQRTERVSKNHIRDLLKIKNIDQVLDALFQLSSRQAVNLLFSFLYDGDPQIKWNAVTAIGIVTAQLADDDMEAARNIIRRLMWNLNDESGGIGWGSPEAMGEILARHKGLAKEYASILISYAREDGNFQEQDMLLAGVLWGIGRLAQAEPALVKGSIHYIEQYLDFPTATLRGLAAWIMGWIETESADSKLEKLQQDEAEFQFYEDQKLTLRRVMDVAGEAIEKNRDVGCSISDNENVS
jgi:hypothetical protein